jgi:ubiquinone/menaquinone biosynthesis C-methylase UbiE
MDHIRAGEYWNENAETWTQLVRSGYDLYRDKLNTPAFLAALPDVRDLSGLDIGCGEGHNTRLLAERGAHMTAIDIAEPFIRHATALELARPMGINYQLASAVALPFADATFDFAVAFMSLMDVPETEGALAEAYRVLRPGGFLQFSISHPCYSTSHRRNLRNAEGLTYAFELGGYFEQEQGAIEEWTFGAAPAEVKAGLRKFQVPRFPRPLHVWVNLMVEIGFAIAWMGEPVPDAATVRDVPYIQDASVLPYFLHVRGRKPGAS